MMMMMMLLIACCLIGKSYYKYPILLFFTSLFIYFLSLTFVFISLAISLFCILQFRVGESTQKGYREREIDKKKSTFMYSQFP